MEQAAVDSAVNAVVAGLAGAMVYFGLRGLVARERERRELDREERKRNLHVVDGARD